MENEIQEIYMLIYAPNEWEDTHLLLSKEDAIQASIKHPELRVEIFRKVNANASGYTPTYHYYKNGQYHGGDSLVPDRPVRPVATIKMYDNGFFGRRYAREHRENEVRARNNIK